MKKNFYTGCIALTLIAGAGTLAAAALSDGAFLYANSKAETTTDNLRPMRCDVNGSLMIENGKGYIKLDIKAPAQGQDADYNSFDLTSLSYIKVTRQKGWSQDPVTIKELTPVTPGDEYVIEDKDESLEIGQQYIYYVTAYNGEVEGMSQSAYVTFGITPKTPDMPELTAEGSDGPVTVKYACPAAETGGWYDDPAPFPEGVNYTRIVLYQIGSESNEVILDSHDNPTPGQEFIYIHNDVQNGHNTYYVRTETNFGESNYSSASIFLGEDYPERLKNLEAKMQADGTVLLTWDEPENGYNGGHLDKEKLEYTVWRTSSSYGDNKELIAEHVKECRFVDELTDVTEERMAYYRVQPSVEGIETPQYTYNYAETSTGFMVGPPSALPFTESFNSGTKYSKATDRLWISDFSYNSFSDSYIRNDQSITVGPNASITLLAGVDGGIKEDELGPDNYFYVSASPWSQSLEPGYLSSGNITLKDATNPIASFYIVPVNDNSGSVTLQVNKGEFDSEQNEVWDDVHVQSYDDPELEEGVISTEANWTKISVPLAAYAGNEKVKIRFKFQYATTENRYPMPFDAVCIDDYPAVTGLAAEPDGETGLKLTWSLPESAGGKNVEYNVYLNDEKITTVDATEYTYNGLEQGESYSFSIEAVYTDTDVTAPKCEPLVYDVAVTSFVVDDVRYAVENDNVSAREYVGEDGSVTIPEKVEYKGKEYTVVSMAPEMLRGNDAVKSITIEAALDEIPENFAYGCTALEAVSLPSSLKKIASKAFFGCVSLNNPAMPAALESIEASAFEHCEAITEVAFGENLSEIGAAAFKGCISLAKVIFSTVTPPAVADDAFEGIADECKGECPEGSETDYRAVEGLKPIAFGTSMVSGIYADGAVSIDYYSLDGNRISGPAHGKVSIARIRYADGTIKTMKVSVK